MVAGNRPSSLGLPPGQPLDHRHGGRLSSTTGELSIHGMGDDYTVEGNGTIRNLPSMPVGMSAVLRILGTPTFVNSTKLICQNGVNYAASPGDLIICHSDGDGAWRLFVLPASQPLAIPPQGRGSLTSGVAITTSDVTGATVAYYVMPTGGGMLPLRDSSGAFRSRLVGQLSNDTTQSSTGNAGPAAVTTNSIYDFFGWDNAGVPTLTRGPPWTSDTARGTGAGTTEIDFTTTFPTNKVAITNGPAAGMGILLFSARSDGSSQLKDAVAFRWLSNVYNAEPRKMSVVEATTSWTPANAAFQQAHATASNQLDFLQSVAGHLVYAKVMAAFASTNLAAFGCVGIDLDTLNTTTIVNNINTVAVAYVASDFVPCVAEYEEPSAVGRHVLIWKEYTNTSAGALFYGNYTGVYQGGIKGWVIN